MSLAYTPPTPVRLRWFTFTLFLNLIIVLFASEVPPDFAVWLCSDLTFENPSVL